MRKNTVSSKSHSYSNYKIPAALKLEATQVESVLKSVRLFFLYQDNPPADQIIVYPQSVHRDEDDTNSIVATVKLVKDYCGAKSHKISVRFSVNKAFNCLPDTLEYV